MDDTVKAASHTISNDLATMDAADQANLVKNGDATVLELVDAAIDRVEQLNPRLNALASTNFDYAREQAKQHSRQGIFAGVPTLLKDLLPYPGHPAGFGSRLLDGAPAASGSDYTAALDNSGLVVLGKSTTSEFGLLGTTETLVKGPTCNPWDQTRSPGGSSGGAVAAVASGMVPIAHASDGGGSIRGPASFCGLFGFKPTRGRTVNAGLPPEMPTSALIADHCVSRSVRDSALWLRATEQQDSPNTTPPIDDLTNASLRGLRVGFYRRDIAGEMPEPEAIAALDNAIALCEKLGGQVYEVKAPELDSRATADAFFDLTGLVLSGIFAQIQSMMGSAFSEEYLEPYTLEIVRRARELSPEAMEISKSVLSGATVSAERSMEQCDVVLSPTVPFAAFPLGQYGPAVDADRLSAFTERLAGYTFVASLAGWPAMSVPLYWTEDGLPVGCHFAAPRGQDNLLFSLAFQLEQSSPWKPRLDALTEQLLCRNA